MNEFIKKLSIETALSYKDSESFIKYIYSIGGTTDTIYDIYNNQGIIGLNIYASQLNLGLNTKYNKIGR